MRSNGPLGARSVRASGRPPYWQPGDVINWRYRRRFGEPGPEVVAPVTVVRDDAAGLAAWLAEDTPMWTVGRAEGRQIRAVDLAERFHGKRVQVQGRWHGPGVLRVAPTGASWSVWYFRDAGGDHLGWYVNLERPHVRDAHNVYTQDYILDVLVTRDRAVVRKDEDELAAAARAGRFTPDEIDHILHVAARAEAAVREWAAPFCDGWEQWSPHPAWPVPQLPAL